MWGIIKSAELIKFLASRDCSQFGRIRVSGCACSCALIGLASCATVRQEA